MFITFEGLDFCGKSTQVKLLEKYFLEKNKEVILIREPGGTNISEKIRNILLDKKNKEMLIETELILFAASRSQLVGEVIIPALEKNKIVISDRFHDSSIAYQAFGRGIELNFVEELQRFVIGKAIPDITFFIDTPIDEIIKRKANVKKIDLDRIERSAIDFYEKVREGYLYLSKKEKRFCNINGLLSIEEIHKQILSKINLKV
ncbi:MAG: dTMP kinase [Stygiobacter sp.]|uniref:Thymidylate kinase n=1 Tax=Stygiobacter electus TaxID=3032292 RepID=A0AAE3TDW7_9BACT|nr:dTMP kinase [Stygiobacter electus]MDF1611852.1 dTMP kinase [Stygiobacter electus]